MTTPPQGKFEIRRDENSRTLSIRMEGYFDIDAMHAFAEEYKTETDAFGGKQHLVLADMRGMMLSGVDASKVFGEAIGYARTRGVACCAHLSDSVLQKLQAARVARQNTPGDDVTVNVISLEEARKVLEEARAKLK